MNDLSLPKRTMIKGLTYRLLSSCVTVGLAYIFIDDIKIVTLIGFLDFIIKWILYYVHERLWHQIKFGKYETNQTKK